MRIGILLVASVFLMVFIIGSVSAEYTINDIDKFNCISLSTQSVDYFDQTITDRKIGGLIECGEIPTHFNFSYDIYGGEVIFDLSNSQQSRRYMGSGSFNNDPIVVGDETWNNIDSFFTGWDLEENEKITASMTGQIKTNNSGQITRGVIYFSTTKELLEKNVTEQRISALESWKETITTIINDILASINALVTKTDNHETRIDILESNNQTGPISNGTTPDFWKYLSSSDRKGIVCGYSKDNHLSNITDLGWNCITTYRNSSRGETSTCRCRAV